MGEFRSKNNTDFHLVSRIFYHLFALPPFAILAEARDPKQAIPARTTTHMLPPRILLSMEAAKMELENAGLKVLARHMDI